MENRCSSVMLLKTTMGHLRLQLFYTFVYNIEHAK